MVLPRDVAPPPEKQHYYYLYSTPSTMYVTHRSQVTRPTELRAYQQRVREEEQRQRTYERQQRQKSITTTKPVSAVYGPSMPVVLGKLQREHEFEAAEFYRRIGYPEYIGYEPFEVPEGMKVADITETLFLSGGELQKGLQVSFEGEPAPKGIAETIMTWHVPSLPSLLGFKRDLSPIEKAVETTGMTLIPKRESIGGGLVGLIGSAEAQMYSMGRLVGLKTPQIPPTFFSLQHQKAMSYGPEYAAGTIMGDVIFSLGVGKVATKVWKLMPTKITSPLVRAGEKITRPVTSRVERWLTSRYLEKGMIGGWVRETTPFEAKYGFITPSGAESFEIPIKSWVGWKEKFVMAVTGVQPYYAAGEVSIPTVEFVTSKGDIIPLVSRSSLEAETLAWEMTVVPRTTGVMITKYVTAPVMTTKLPLYFGLGKELIPFAQVQQEQLGFQQAKALTPLKWEKTEELGAFSRIKYTMPSTGKYHFIKGYMPPPARELEKLLPFVTQTHLTKMGVHPYIPFKTASATGKKVSLAFGVLAGTATVSLPKLVQPQKIEKMSRIESFERLKLYLPSVPKRVEKQKRVLAAAPLTIIKTQEKTVQKLSQATKQTLKLQTAQKQFQRAMQRMMPPSVIQTTTTVKPFRLPTRKRRKGKRDMFDRLGSWFYKEHPIPTEKQLLRNLEKIGLIQTRKRGR